jgi:hypothetical protein
MDCAITWTGGAEVVKWNDVTSGTREVRFDSMVEVFIGSADVLAKDSRI